MAATITNIRTMSGAGILASRTEQDASLGFLKYNLVYGFNGSGKSTLSRLFASAQSGTRDTHLPPDCSFEFALSEGAPVACPNNLAGLQARVLVFNADFIERNVQWMNGTAKPVFYIGADHADAAARLQRKEAERATVLSREPEAEKLLRATERTLATFKRDRAKLIAEQGRFVGRGYEARELEGDYKTLDLSSTAILTEAAVNAARATCEQTHVEAVAMIPDEAPFEAALAVEAVQLATSTPGATVLRELQDHPRMVLWVRQGVQYHDVNGLSTCLYCDSPIRPARRAELEQAFDDRLEQYLKRIRDALAVAQRGQDAIHRIRDDIPAPLLLLPEFREPLGAAETRLRDALQLVERAISGIIATLSEKFERPTLLVDVSRLLGIAETDVALKEVRHAINALNEVADRHNQQAARFRDFQAEARLALRRHYLAEVKPDYEAHLKAHEEAGGARTRLQDTSNELRDEIERLRRVVRQHGTAAAKINKILASYLGHGELTIGLAVDGYEIHRHGKLVTGPPSEGEKTAIALSYFLSSLEADGRKLKNAIVVIDDPISSLDSKALNYACALVRSSVEGASQVFIFTHNLACMNEFKKKWKRRAYPTDDTKEATARLLFMDVRMPADATVRATSIVEMPELLREYDSEYHLLFKHVSDFASSAGTDYQYSYMMPNVMRRVLDVFLAFKCPGMEAFANKMENLSKEYGVERARLIALDRLAQVESHSDSLDDLLNLSPITVEESHAAANLLIEIMREVDRKHTDLLLKIVH